MSELLRLQLGKAVHGGYCLARHDGRVILVRHGAPGEEVMVRLTDTGKTWRGEVVDVISAHPQRIEVAWGAAGPGGVGAELAHLSRPAQLEWKRGVMDDALQRIGGMELPITVSAPDDGDGWHTRTRIELTTDETGRAGMRRNRSRVHVPLQDMPLAVTRLNDLGLFTTSWPAEVRLTAVAPSDDDPVVLINGQAPSGHPGTIRERVGEFSYSLTAGGFWQAHYQAPRILTEAVLHAAGELLGARVFDLFSGAGLFTLPLAAQVGEQGSILAVEGDRRASRSAKMNAREYPQVTTLRGDVARMLSQSGPRRRADVVVLDPPRVGARRDVMKSITDLAPERIIYVSCDPAALARDLAVAAEYGYQADSVIGYDLFPHTHHIESVTVLRPRS